MSSTLLNPRSGGIRLWADTPEDLPIGTPRKFVETPAFNNLGIVPGLGFEYEHRRMLANPHLYDDRDIEHMHEMWLTVHALTEWPCDTCGHTNLTPDAEFSMASPCTSPSCPSHTQES